MENGGLGVKGRWRYMKRLGAKYGVREILR